jgi:sulfoxide reductase catalytic subunit YedY
MNNLGDIPSTAAITPESLYLRRREFLRNALLFTATSTSVGGGLLWLMQGNRASEPKSSSAATPSLTVSGSSSYNTAEPQTPYQAITTYNNFYEFGLDKSDPAENAHTLKPRPWTLRVEGEVRKPLEIDIDQLLKWFPLEERIYRMRCVEAWSMVIPWLGFPLGDLLKRVEPTSRAKYVAFTSLFDPKQMPEQRQRLLDWPYVEGLRIDEAVHPLTLLVVGLYGKELPNQNGAPLRLIIPWKYGFKRYQVHCDYPFDRGGATDDLELSGASGVWVLRQCEPGGRSPALESSDRAADWRFPTTSDTPLQRVRRTSR